MGYKVNVLAVGLIIAQEEINPLSRSISSRQFERTFSYIIGATPKQFFADCEPFSDEKGETLFLGIPSGDNFLIIFARELDRYTEKYIEVSGGDTLKLTKVFTPDSRLLYDLEPWDYIMPLL